MRKLTCLIAVAAATSAIAAPSRSLAAADAHVLSACQDLIGKAVRRFTNDLERHIARCAVHGIGCLVGAGASTACCERAAARCTDDVRKMAEAERRFDVLIARRACSRIAFDDIVGATGLDFSGAIASCRCLAPPVDVVDLSSLTDCLRRMTAVETVDLITGAEVPKARDALTCMGLDGSFPGVAEAPPSAGCAAGSPTPTVTASSAPGATPSATGGSGTATPITTTAPSATASSTAAAPSTPTATSTSAATSTFAATSTVLAATLSPSSTPESTGLALPTATATATAGATGTPSATATAVSTPVATPTAAATTTRTPTPRPTPLAVCGNGIVEGDEECDGLAFDTTFCATDVCTCDDFCDNPGGTLSCNPDCTINFSACTGGGCSF